MQTRRQQDRRKSTVRGVTGYDRRKVVRRHTLRKDTLMFASVEPSDYAALNASFSDFSIFTRFTHRK